MRTSESSSSGTVLHRLIQEQLRFGGPTDTRVLLAIREQALRGGGGSSGSSKENLAPDELLQMSARQEPQGQEHRGEGLPTYQEAKARAHLLTPPPACDPRREHARSLSERLLQLSLERSWRPALLSSASRSSPQLLPHRRAGVRGEEQRGPPPQYPARLHEAVLKRSEVHTQFQTTTSVNSQLLWTAHTGVTSSTALQNQKPHVYADRDARLQKLESEIRKITESYETLTRGSAKREALEKAMRGRMEEEIRRMHDVNRDLRERLETNYRPERLDPTQHIFVKLLEQSEEQLREKELLEEQVQRLLTSEEECRRRRELLEQTAASAQARSRLLEEELRQQRAHVQKVERLQSALLQLQAACEKREVLELRLRRRLEQELKGLRAQRSWEQPAQPRASDEESASLRQQLREKEERILALEADVTRWEQKYLEESTMRQFAMDAAATAAAQRDTTIINHSPRHSPDSSFNEDLPLLSFRRQEMENRIRVLRAQLLEKDVVIKALQQNDRGDHRGLRATRSVPTINTLTGSSERKGRSRSDDQTAASKRDRGGTRSEPEPEPQQQQQQQRRTEAESSERQQASEENSSTGPPEEPETERRSTISTSAAAAEVVEILI